MGGKWLFKLTQSHQKQQEMFQAAAQVRPGFSSARKQRKNATVPPAGSLQQGLEKPSHRAGCTTAPLLQRSDGTVLPLSLADPAPSTQLTSLCSLTSQCLSCCPECSAREKGGFQQHHQAAPGFYNTFITAQN